ncbi:MAG: GlcG/HbpS family heme-binding protein [Ktedonobacteraceae bacterium]
MSLTIDVARRVLEACKQRAHELRSPVSIAIVDAGGHLVLFERMMSPYGWATGNISLAKATTAVMFNQSTDAVAQWGAAIPGFASSMAEMSQGKFIMAAGGWPLRMNGATIGGVGVSGGNAPGRDDEIARAGLGALEAMRAAVPMTPGTQYSPQQVPVYAQPVPTAMQPAPAYPSRPMPVQEQPAASSVNLDMAKELASQESPYGSEASAAEQYTESSESSGTSV